MAIRLGATARDTITGFEGVVVARTQWLNQCDRLTLQPKGPDKDGTLKKSASFDEPQLAEVHGQPIHDPLPVNRPAERVCLGDVVEDRISGVTGVAIARSEWIGGCSRVRVQGRVLKPDGAPLDTVAFDETDLVVLVASAPPEPVKTGGPRPEPTR